MAGRYTGWFGKAGDTDASPALRNRARKLLGEVATQQELGGPPHMVKRANLPDGSKITAQISHGVPKVTIKQVQQTGGDILAQVFKGFCTAPRTFASPTAFDDFPDVIINTSTEAEPARTAFFYEGGPLGRPYKHNTFGQELYHLSEDDPPTDPGLRINSFGYVDWRDASEDVTINYGGPPNRYFSVNGGGLDVFVYHNGEALLDNNVVTADGGGVAGACISHGYLVWCTVQTGGFGGALTYKLYRAKIHRNKRPRWANGVAGTPVLLGPRYQPLINGDAELLFTAEIPSGAYQFYVSNVFFNQSGNELRGLYYDTDATTLYARELTINFADWADIGSADVQLASYSETVETTRSYPVCRANGIKHTYATVQSASDVISGEGGLPDGSYSVDESGALNAYWHKKATTYNMARGTVGDSFVDPYLLALDATYTRTVTPAVDGNFPVAVDYQDDRPVYAYLRAAASTETCAYTGSMAFSETYDHYMTFNYSTGLFGGITDELYFLTYSRHLDASSNSSYSKTGATLGLWAPKTRPDDEVGNWLDVQLSFDDAGSTSASSESDYATDGAADTSSDSALYAATVNITSTEAARLSVWWMDLRFDSAVYSAHRVESAIEDTRSYAGTFTGTAGGNNSPIIGWVGDSSNQYLMSLPGSRDATTTRTKLVDTYVVMNREQVASCSGSRPVADDVYSSAAPLADYDQAMFGLRALGLCEKEAALFDGMLGGLYDAASIAAWEVLYAPNPPFNKVGPMDFPDYVVDPEAAETTIVDRVVADTHAADTPDYSISDLQSAMCAGNWLTEGNLHPGSDFDRVPGGAWIYLRGDWAFSMAWLNGDTSTIQWHSVLRAQDAGEEQTLDTITGQEAHSYAPMWPFAKSLYAYFKK